MLFSAARVIFVHVPKTAGNHFTLSFLKYADDRLVTGGTRDGIDRFELVGPQTQAKHQTLAQYAARLGDRMGDYTVYATARNPCARMRSLYYSPRRWAKVGADGYTHITEPPDTIDVAGFMDLVAKAPSLCEMLDSANLSGRLALGQEVTHCSGAKVRLFDFDRLADDLAAFAARHGMTAPDYPDRRINATAQPNGASLPVALSDALAQTRHRADFSVFD